MESPRTSMRGRRAMKLHPSDVALAASLAIFGVIGTRYASAHLAAFGNAILTGHRVAGYSTLVAGYLG
jgi:hypothetical protein